MWLGWEYGLDGRSFVVVVVILLKLLLVACLRIAYGRG